MRRVATRKTFKCDRRIASTRRFFGAILEGASHSPVIAKVPLPELFDKGLGPDRLASQKPLMFRNAYCGKERFLFFRFDTLRDEGDL